MRKLLPLILLSALILTGCGENALESRYESFARELGEREDLSFTAELRCEYPDRSVRFALAYQETKEGETVTVLSPENIAGIRALRREGGTSLEFEGLILDTGDLDPYGLSPMNALPLLTDSLRRGHPDSLWTEGEDTLLSLVRDDHLTVRVRFDRDMRPVQAELYSDDRLTVFCEISDWR